MKLGPTRADKNVANARSGHDEKPPGGIVATGSIDKFHRRALADWGPVRTFFERTNFMTRWWRIRRATFRLAVASAALGFAASGLVGCGSSESPAPPSTSSAKPRPKREPVETPLPAPSNVSSGDTTTPANPVRRFAVRPFEEWTMRETAAAALGRIGKPAVTQLVEALQSPNAALRHQAADTLARIGPSAAEAVPALVVAMDDRDPLVRKAAARALGQIGPAAAEAVPRLINMLIEEDHERPTDESPPRQ